MYYTYILRCDDNSLYTGMTNDIKKRVNAHYRKKPECAKYTRSHNVVAIERVWQTESKSLACKLEYRIKKLSKSEKQYLIDNPLESNLLSEGKFSVFEINLSEVIKNDEK